MAPMDVEPTPAFERHLRQRANRKVRKIYRDRLALFTKNPYDPSLNVHSLKHEYDGYSSFSLTDDEGTDDFRVIFKKTKDSYALFDFGTHDQLYRPWRGK